MPERQYSLEELQRMGATPAPPAALDFTAPSKGKTYTLDELQSMGAKPGVMPSAILAQQAAQFPTAAEQGGKPGAVATPLAYQGAVGTLARIGHAVQNTGEGVDTGMDSPAVKLLAAAVPGGAATEGMGIVDGLKSASAVQLAKAIRNLIPSTKRAGVLFDQVMAAAKDVPIETSTTVPIIERAQQIDAAGGSPLPRVLKKFVKASSPGESPFSDVLTYKEGRDFASNAGSQSIKAVTAQNAQMQRQVAQFADAMKTANREAAAKVGMGDLYDQAMKEYRQAKTLQDAAAVLQKWGLRAGAAALLGAGGVAGVKLYGELTGK